MRIFIGCLYGLMGFVITWGLIPVIRKFVLTSGIEKGRSFHHTHKVPVPRFGGVAFVAAFVLVALTIDFFYPGDAERTRLRFVIVLGSLAMFFLGFWDDIRSLGAKRKLLAQILIAGAVYYFGVQITKLRLPFFGFIEDLGMWSGFVTVVWIVTITNLINLIDGIDGLAGGTALMLMVLLSCVGWQNNSVFSGLLSCGMAGAMMGFLRFNFPPAKIYMGDGGAYFLGFLISVLTITNSHKGTITAALIAPLFALALPIVDVSFAIVRRGLKGLPVFRPDQQHIHHRLSRAGYSRRKAVLILYGLSLLCLLLAFAAFWSEGRLVPILFGCLFLIILVSARSFGFVQDWFAIGSVVGNSLEMRKEIRYALALSRWLEMEAERCDSIENLWADFKFVGKKMGFSEIKLTLEDGERSWHTSLTTKADDVYFFTHELHVGNKMTLELKACPSVMEPQLFDMLNELAAEAWLKSATQWKSVHSLPVQFSSRMEIESNQVLARHKRAYLPS